jgi:hypothetical protein
VQGVAHLAEGVAVAGLQVCEEDFVGGPESVLDGVHAGLGFAFGGSGHSIISWLSADCGIDVDYNIQQLLAEVKYVLYILRFMHLRFGVKYW